jgi:DNA-binding NarL/FixJ family response regulator
MSNYIARAYATENLSMIQIGEKLDCSTRTIKVHIDSHNAAVKRSGLCAACKRTQSAYASQEVERGVI